MSSCFTLRQSRWMNTLSIQRLFPSMVMAIPGQLSFPVHS
jgi:hypothetical protein